MELGSVPMEQEIRFCEIDGRRLAYGTVGEGPLLVFSARWITHLEDEWELPEVRRFYEGFASTHRVVRYDRIGVGLSDREAPSPSIESEARALATVLDECGSEPAIVFACSCAGLATARLACGAKSPASICEASSQFVRTKSISDTRVAAGMSSRAA